MTNCCCSSEACRLNGCQANKGLANTYNPYNALQQHNPGSSLSSNLNDQNLLAAAIHRLAAAIEKLAEKS